MLTDIDAVFFDLDGTLVDSMGVWEKLDVEFARNHNLLVPEGFNKNIEGMSFEETAEYYIKVFPNLSMTKDEIMNDWYDSVIFAYSNTVKLKSGAFKFLKLLKERGIKTAITSSNHRSIILETLKSNNLNEYFDEIVTSGEAGNGKPSPDVYIEAAKRLLVSPDRGLVFEDVPNGILAGKNAGMKVCAVWDKYSSHQTKEKKALADYYINDFSELI